MRNDWAKRLTKAFSGQRILVVGDLVLDRYIHGTVERISPEAPVPVVRVGRERQVLGGAANVAGNIRALGGEAVMAGVVGRDQAGRDLLRILGECGIGTEGVRVVADMQTTVKMRVLADRQQVVRVDWDPAASFPQREVAAFCALLEKQVARCSGVVIEDYSKGLIRQDIIDVILAAARKQGIPVGLDPKDNAELDLSGITLAKPNYREAHLCAGVPIKGPQGSDPLKDESLRKAGQILLRRWKPQQLIVTLGPQGMYLVSRGKRPRVIPTRAREVFDVSGAGDTVIATCVLALAAGATFDEAAILGNNAAGVVVGKLGTATCSPEELLASVEANEH